MSLVWFFRILTKLKSMANYTAIWQDKETVIIYDGEKTIGKISFEDVKVVVYNNATIHADGEIYSAQATTGKDVIFKKDGREIFTVAPNSLWGNFEVRANGQDTGYDIKGRWFKPGTRFTDANDNELIVVKSDPWTGKEMTVEIAGNDISDLMVLATLFHHIRASAAKTTAAIVGTWS